MTPTNVLPYALAAARRGWHVFPLRTRAKRPVRTFTDWERHATTDQAAITAHWGAHPAHNVAVACGPSGLVVVDLDTPKDGETPPPEWARPGITNGTDVLAALAEKHADGDTGFLDTFTVTTRRGGTHLYYAAPDGAAYRNTSGRLGWLIDTRATGGYVVGPGSYVADTDGRGPYEVTNPAAVAQLPGWLATLLEPARRRPMSSGQVHSMLASHPGAATYVTRALRGEVDCVLAAREGSRNHTLNKAAFAVGTLVGAGMLPKHLAEDALTAAGERIGLDPTECEATVRSGLQAGVRRPRGAAA
ncbi:bifunctional DNA primase/polymerase-like protein [Nocardiopsis sp. Huas11]|uniref:bifunctional DNA primase/polymerase n=1 Tax=Nocardiopsis sp. Huas11 TaxID=2183912 RepID=UPI000EAEC55C|nr:bifunctional DNA primase/polymerase [Nocardiopsis sp. Huas11]RKS06709.1 bifunctional DNA primase/polymerase-like protein [Nocardiopsis sp. Huas11]